MDFGPPVMQPAGIHTPISLHPIIHVHLITFTDPRGLYGWVGHVGWPIADGLTTKWSPVQLAVWHSIGKVCRPRPTFYPLCYAAWLCTSYISHCCMRHLDDLCIVLNAERQWWCRGFIYSWRQRVHASNVGCQVMPVQSLSLSLSNIILWIIMLSSFFCNNKSSDWWHYVW